MLTVFLGADHAGLALKHALADRLRLKRYDIQDLGAHTLEPKDDYPEYAARVAHAVMTHAGSFGILLCGSAEGMCMAANKFSGIRAGIGFSNKAAELMRMHDDANILCIPTRVEILNDPYAVVDTFLTTPFSEELRHKRRIEHLEEL